MASPGDANAESQKPTLVVEVKHGKRKFEIPLPDGLLDCTVEWLMCQIENETDPIVMRKHQKLLSKGKSLDAKGTIQSQCQFKHGKTVVMLLASHGGGGAPPAPLTAGQVALAKSRAAKAKNAYEKRNDFDENPMKFVSGRAQNLESRAVTWKTTGIVGLRSLALTDIPASAFESELSVRVVDVSGNLLAAVPRSVSSWQFVVKLNFSSNKITVAGVPWKELTGLPNLTCLNLAHNLLAGCLPIRGLGEMPKLQELVLDGNKIESLDATIGDGDEDSGDTFFFPALTSLSFANNLVTDIPPEFGKCDELELVDGSGNLLTEIPADLANASKLKTLALDRNPTLTTAGIPSELLLNAKALDYLSVHQCSVSMEALREKNGWREYDARRIRRAGKVLASKVMLGKTAFDEGGDTERIRRH